MESRASKPANLIYTPSQIVRAMAVFGLPFAPEATFAIAAILVVTGLALAFFGHGLWSTVMSLIGALLGSAVGLLAAALVYGVMGGRATFAAGRMDTPLVVALLVLVVVFGIAYYFIDNLIGIITAAIGGLLLAGGLSLFGIASAVAALAGIGAFAIGAYVQTSAIRRRRQARAMAAAAASPPPPQPPPPPPR